MTTDDFHIEAKRLRPLLHAIAMRYLHSSDDAEDIIQDALLKLWTMRDELRMPVEPLARVLVRNKAIDLIRRTQPGISIDDLQLAGEEPPPTDGIERMMNIVDTLPSMQQTILRLRHMEGMEMSDIAKLTGSTEVAVRKALSRARQTVRNEYYNRYKQ